MITQLLEIHLFEDSREAKKKFIPKTFMIFSSNGSAGSVRFLLEAVAAFLAVPTVDTCL